MKYAIADLHGCYELFRKMLGLISFSDEDTLYILGDIVDRSPGGPDIILDIANRENVVALAGNHDYTALAMLKTFGMANDGFMADSRVEAFASWLTIGGSDTYQRFLEMNEEGKATVIRYLERMSRLYYEITNAGGKKFFLAHTVPGKRRMDDVESWRISDFIMGVPEYGKDYFPDMYVVTGHTPTGLIDERYTGRIAWPSGKHIAIDCGAVFGFKLGCLRLDDLKEFYVKG